MSSSSVDPKLRAGLREVLETRILDWYERISRYAGPDAENWVPYIKNYEVRFGSNRSISIRPITAYVPRIYPFLSVTCSNGEHIGFRKLFDVSEEVIYLLRSFNVEIPYEPRVRRATREIILLAFEASQLQLPSRDEIKRRIMDNLGHLLYRSIEKATKVRSVAPVIGCTFTDSLLLGDVTFRNPIEQDLALIMLAQQRSPVELPMDLTLLSHPVLVVDHDVDMQPDPRKYSFEESVSILHISFKNHVRDALFAIRLGSQPDAGFSSVFHVDSEWTTPESLRLVTEEPYPTYRTVVTETMVPRLRAMVPRIALQRQPIIDTFNSLKTAHSKADKTSLYHLDLAIRRFDQALSRDNSEDQLIDFIIALETLAMLSQEQAFRLAVWTAVLVGTNNKSRYSVFQDIKAAYRLRSQIVHGTKVPDEQKVYEYASRTISYLCSVLRKLLQILPEKNLKAIREELDRRIFSVE